MHVAHQELTSEEVNERLQGMGMILVDKLSEVTNLKKRLREVEDFEERLEDVDGMAERLQGLIEEELGIEEVERLREELERDEQTQVERTIRTVVKKSVRSIERKEDEVDELEDQIKQVFFKGLLPEEVEVDQERVKEVTDETLLDDSLREKLRQIEKEWQDEVEERFGSSDDGTASAVSYQKAQRKIKKRVTIADETGQQQEDMEDMLGQPGVIIEDGLENQKLWRKTELLEDRTEREATERLWESFKKAEEKDDWYIMFDRPPYKAVFKSPGTV